MGLQRHTIIVVPHGGARFRKYRVTSRQIVAVLSTVVALTGIAGFSIWYSLSHQRVATELEELRGQNEDLRAANRSFEDSARHLQRQLSQYEDRAAELAIIAGVENATSPLGRESQSTEVGVGGAGNPDDFLPDLPSMTERAQAIRAQLDEVGDSIRERSQLIAARPAIMPVKGVFTSTYGYRQDPITGVRAFHRGIDLSAPAGNEVRATADGIVTQAGTVGGYGRSVFLAHGFGYATRYAHMSQIDVEPGQRIRRGQALGRVGRSGRATGYHVHYEVHEDGRSMNPLEFILDSTLR